MIMQSGRPLSASVGLLILIAAQIFCAAFFLSDVIADFWEPDIDQTETSHLLIETIASVTLVAAIVFEWKILTRLLRRQDMLENSLSQANSAVYEVIEAHFDDWNLTPSERDVANFVIKGMATAEIAELRGSAEATVKTHLNAVYRKSGTRNRAEMLSLIIDSITGVKASQAPE